jgi:hypothetical protein
MSENRLLKGGSRRQEVAGGWRRLHNEELHNLYASPNIIRVIKSRRVRWAEYVARIREMRNSYKMLFGKPEGKRPLGRPRRRWGVLLEWMLAKEVGYLWICLAQNRDQ